MLDLDRGTELDPACGSGGMFVQSARTVEEHGGSPTERLTFRGVEKNDTTIRLARMNLAVHGLEGDIQQAITYYHDPHELLGRADYVMANPPNVDEIDAGKVRTDPRLPFGLPGVNRKQKVGNGNYVWISYFHSYVNETGRAGFVMSSQASSAGGAEAEVRRRLVETGDVEVMIAVRSNFFYTRTVPCELWFLNRGKPDARRGKVLMIDARHVYRKVTRKIYDFSPEQQQNLLAVVWLYRGQTARFLDLVARYLGDAADAHTLMQAIARANRVAEGKNNGLIVDYCGILRHLRRALATFAGTRAGGGGREIDPAQPDRALLAEPAAAIGAGAALSRRRRGAARRRDRQAGLARNAAIVACKEAANANDENRKRFEVLCREVFGKFKACVIRGVNAHRADRDAVDVVYRSLQRDRGQADVSNILRTLHEVVDEAIDVRAGQTAEERPTYNVSAIDFDRLKREFERSPSRQTAVQALRHAVEQRVRRLLARNPLRTDFHHRHRASEVLADHAPVVSDTCPAIGYYPGARLPAHRRASPK